jgi:hypothetical protein
MAWLDPRRTVDRVFAGAARIQRALEFVEFLESQEPVILEAQNSLFGFRRRLRSAKRRLVTLGGSVLVVGLLLYLVLAYRNETEDLMPVEGSYPVLHYGLLGLLVLLIVVLVANIRGMGDDR